MDVKMKKPVIDELKSEAARDYNDWLAMPLDDDFSADFEEAEKMSKTDREIVEAATDIEGVLLVGIMAEAANANEPPRNIVIIDPGDEMREFYARFTRSKISEMLDKIGQLRAEIREWKGCLDVADMEYMGIELPGGDIDSDYAHFTPDVMLQLLDKKDEEIGRLKSENERLRKEVDRLRKERDDAHLRLKMIAESVPPSPYDDILGACYEFPYIKDAYIIPLSEGEILVIVRGYNDEPVMMKELISRMENIGLLGLHITIVTTEYLEALSSWNGDEND